MTSAASNPRTLPPGRLLFISTVISAAAALLAVWVFVLRPANNEANAPISPSDFVAPIPEFAELGKVAPVVDLGTFDEQTISTGDFVGKPTVINFWASTCAPCVAEMPMLEAVYQEMKDEVNFLGISTFEGLGAGEKMIESTGVTFPQARDVQGEALAAFNGTALPHTVILNSNGTVAAMHQLELKDVDELRALIAEAT